MLRGEKCNKPASSRPVILEKRDMFPRKSAHCPSTPPRCRSIDANWRPEIGITVVTPPLRPL
jgi:hypothetical protein